MAVYGYARVSTEDQDASLQVDVLRAAGCARVMEETASGTNRTGRPKLKILLDFIGGGDVLMVTRIKARPIGVQLGTFLGEFQQRHLELLGLVSGPPAPFQFQLRLSPEPA